MSETRELVVLIHGFLGGAFDYKNFVAYCAPRLKQVEFFICKANEWKTRDGITQGAKRIYNELEVYLIQNKDKYQSISLVGHSLGGLYARYLAYLFQKNDFCRTFSLKPSKFYSFQAPNLGIDTYRSFMGQNFAFYFFKCFGLTVREILLVDEKNFEDCFMYKLSTKDFIDALKLFDTHILYCNIKNDSAVPYLSGSIRDEEDGLYFVSKHTSKLKLFLTGFGLCSGIFNKEKLEADEKYKNLTKLCVSKNKKTIPENPEATEVYDEKQEASVDQIRKNLNTLIWKKYDAVFHTLIAHEQIVAKRICLEGESILHHFCDNF
eukprot:snap_masked-scaffold_6-processed-gene-16.39-mRNA-1 protein AED:1.00 eAED:1.00 QI:0/-1/0/0/-1/1/1/0/320